MNPAFENFTVNQVRDTGVVNETQAAAASGTSGPQLEAAIRQAIATQIDGGAAPNIAVIATELAGGADGTSLFALLTFSNAAENLALRPFEMQVIVHTAGSIGSLRAAVTASIVTFQQTVIDDPQIDNIRYIIDTAIANAGTVFAAAIYWWALPVPP